MRALSYGGSICFLLLGEKMEERKTLVTYSLLWSDSDLLLGRNLLETAIDNQGWVIVETTYRRD